MGLILVSCLVMSCGDPEKSPPPDGDEEDELPSDGTETGTSDVSGATDTDGRTTDTEAPSDVDSIAAGRPQALRGACPTKEEFGRFDLVYVDKQSSIDGTVRDGFAGSITEQVTQSGDCRVLKKLVAFCDPACLSGELCDEMGACIPYPLNQDVGTVTLFGAAEEVALTPVSGSNLYFDTSLVVPPFAPGAALALRADGGEFAPFTLYGTGVAMLVTGDQEWTVARGMPIEVTWESGSVTDATISISINIDQHGTSPAVISCETPDTGSLTVPATLIDELIDLGISGRPSGMLERHTEDSVETDFSCVSFTVRSYRSVPVAVGTV